MSHETKKDKILSASLKEFADNGFDKASTDKISRDAGVSKGLVFHYFKNKENLYITTINMCIDDIFEAYEGFDYYDPDFCSALTKLMELKYNFFVKNPLHYSLLIKSFYNSPKKLQKRLADRYSEIKQVGIDIVVDMISHLPLKSDVDKEDIVTVIMGITNVVEGRYLSYFIDNDSNFDKYYDLVKNDYIKLINIVMYGILN